MRSLKRKNNLKTGKRIATAVLFFAVVLLCVTAVNIPPSNYYIEMVTPLQDDVLQTLNKEDILFFNGCDIKADGYIAVTGEDPNIVLSVMGADAKSVKINFLSAAEDSFPCTFYYDEQMDFSEEGVIRQTVFKGDSYIAFNLPDGEIGNIRIDIDCDYALKNIELHQNTAAVEQTQIPVSAGRYVFACAFSLIFLVLFILFDSYIYPVSEKLLSLIKQNAKSILLHIIAVLIAVILAVPIEFCLAKFIFGKSSMGMFFNPYRYFFTVCALSCLATIIIHIKDKAKNAERLFIWLILFAGVSLILCAPFGHICWDYDSHTRFVLERSYIGEVYITDADKMTLTVQDFDPNRTKATENNNLLATLNSKGSRVVEVQKGAETTIAHVPAGVTLAVFRFLGFNYALSIMASRLMNLIIYSAVCYFAIKKLSSGKMVLATIAFFPTNLFLATTYSYDFWVTAFLMLGFACYIEELRNPQKPAEIRDAIVMCGAFALGCIPKQIYMPVMLLPLVLFKKWGDKRKRNRYYAVCALMFVLLFVLLMTRSLGEVAKGGDTRGGDVDAAGQIAFILGNPLKYAKILLGFLKGYLSVSGMRFYTVFFAYIGLGSLGWLYTALIIITALTDKSPLDKFRGMHITRILNIVMFFGIVCLVATSLYVAYTPVGLETINGCQSRYIVPVLLPLLLTIANPGLQLKFDKRIYNTVILSVLSFGLLYNVYTVLLQRLL